MGSTDWSYWVIKLRKKKRLSWWYMEEVSADMGGVGVIVVGEYDQNTLYEIFKGLIKTLIT